MSSMDSATSRAPRASNPGRVIISRVSLLSRAALATRLSRVAISPLRYPTCLTNCAMILVSPGFSLRPFRNAWYLGPDVFPWPDMVW